MASVSGLPGELRDMGTQVLNAGRNLRDGATSVNWNGPAADQFRAHAESQVSDFQNCAKLLDAAAAKITALAAEL